MGDSESSDYALFQKAVAEDRARAAGRRSRDISGERPRLEFFREDVREPAKGSSIEFEATYAGVDAPAYSPFAFMPTEDHDGDIYPNSFIFLSTTSLTETVITTGMTGISVAAGDFIYLEIEQDSALEFVAAQILCDSTWDEEMFETAEEGSEPDVITFVKYVRIGLHEIIADDSAEDYPRPGILVSDGSTTLKIATLWSHHVDFGHYRAENGLTSKVPIAHAR